MYAKKLTPTQWTLLSVLSVILFFLSLRTGFFWDNVLFASKMGGYLYENSLFDWNIPVEFDPGHPATLAFINALGWKIFGQHLWASHLMMLPFVFGFLVQLLLLVKSFVKNNRLVLAAFILIIADPTISSEMILVSPEIIQLFFFLWAINSIHKNNHVQKTIALAFLGIIFFRGMMLCAGVFIYELIRHIFFNRNKLISFFNHKIILSYMLGSIPAIYYVTWRLVTKGWLQSHPDSPWSTLWQYATPAIFLRNLLILANRLGDFGRVFILLFIVISFIIIKKVRYDKSILQIIIIGVSAIFVVTIISVMSQNAFGHRYFIAFFITSTLAAFVIIKDYIKPKKIVYILLISGLITGNLWIYPEKIAQGWSASLAYYPYFKLRHQAIQYIDEQQMNVDDFASFFPNICSIHEVDLNGDQREFQEFTGENKYVFYSNVYNLNDNEYTILNNKYQEIKRFTKFNVEVKLLKKIE